MSNQAEERISVETMTPTQIVSELDKYIVGQRDAKKAVAIAIRNRVRRQRVEDSFLQEEIYPKNIVMIGPTGCGKTEIARRLARLSGAPFVKVEATKYTEVGYVGRDVESMIRDLVSSAVNLVKKEFQATVEEQARRNTEERILDALLPGSGSSQNNSSSSSGAMAGMGDLSEFARNLQRSFEQMTGQSSSSSDATTTQSSGESHSSSSTSSASSQPSSQTSHEDLEKKARVRELMRQKLKAGEFDDKEIEIEVSSQSSPMVQVLSGPNMEEMDMQLQNMLGDIMPKKTKRRKVSVEDARKILMNEELEKLVDPEKVQSEAIRRTEQLGIVFLDEIDKVCGKNAGGSPDVSREGVQRDLLPIVEGATVNTRNGPVKTDHILFIAAGAFHATRPSDLIPELQGRFPIRVELEKLTEKDFLQILTGPENSLTRQAQALLATEGVDLHFSEDGLEEIASVAFRVNDQTENIGARRLHTIMEHLLEEVSFQAPDIESKKVVVDRAFVQDRLQSIVENRDLSQYIL
ncbi:MAG: HslU--HslV peptidase ATPase subunit [Spirochaetaceae bacterium]|nr:HslU--HslV peptidase ATPase subunit [Spirochaetaceae bacterium]|tara:strand:- start:11963 stop:13525 length:1563 start_codon:yes stop_codon:yes gene_type:complete